MALITVGIYTKPSQIKAMLNKEGNSQTQPLSVYTKNKKAKLSKGSERIIST